MRGSGGGDDDESTTKSGVFAVAFLEGGANEGGRAHKMFPKRCRFLSVLPETVKECVKL